MIEIVLLGCARFRKSILPFTLTLAAGLLLAAAANRVNSLQGRRPATAEVAAESRERGKTWLFITSLPGRSNPLARGGGREGGVRMRVVFGEGGLVRGAQTETVDVPGASEEESAAFEREALDAAARVGFRPATVDGRPVALGAAVEYNCSTSHFAHRAYYGCGLSIVKVDGDWRIIYE